MPNQKTLKPGAKWTPKSLKNLALWFDASDPSSLYTTDAGPVTPVTLPTDIAGCVGWWDASDSSVVTVSGGLVSQLQDKSQFLNHASASGALRPTLVQNALNGRSVLRFTGTQGLTGNFTPSITTNQYTVFAVTKMAAPTTNGRVFSTAGAAADFSSGSVIPCCTNATSLDQLSAYNGSTSNVSAAAGFTNYAVFAGACTGTTVTNASNGMSSASGVSSLTIAQTRFGIGIGAQGGTGFLAGDIAEIIYYNTALTAATRNSIEAYLARKWGIASVHVPSSQEAAPVSSPLELGGCVGWYDSADLTTLKTNSDGTGDITSTPLAPVSIGYWRDKSPTGAHVTQDTPSKRPTLSPAVVNGRAALTFNYLNSQTLVNLNYTAQTGLPGITRIAVCQSTAPSGVISCLAKVTATGATGYSPQAGNFIFINGSIRGDYDSAGGSNLISTSAAGNGPAIPLNIYADVYTGGSPATAAFHIGGSPAATTTLGTLPAATGGAGGASMNLYIGSNTDVNFYWQGSLAEYIVFNRALTQVELDRVEKYLGNKWGFASVPSPTPPVGYLRDKSSNLRHATTTTSSLRPYAGSLNSKQAVGFDGTDDLMGTPAIANSSFDPSGACVWIVYEPYNDTNYSLLRTVLNGSGYERFTNGAMYSSFFRTDRLPALTPGAPSTGRTLLTNSLSGNTQSVQINGAVYHTVPNGSYAAWRNSTIPYQLGYETQWLNGAIGEVIVLSRAPTPAEVRRVNAYLASKWGVTLAPQVSNADAQSWINRVYANGGTVSAATAGAVNEFCNTIDRIGALRLAFYRLNLFCGNSDANLIAVRTPLYLSPNKTSANLFQHGNDLTNTIWQAGGNGAFTRTLVTSPSASEVTPLQTIPTKLTTANSNPQFQIWQSPILYNTTVTLSVWLKANTGTIEMGWLKGGAVATDTFNISTTWTRYFTTFTLPAFSGQADIRSGLYNVTPLNGSQHVLAYGMQLEIGTSATGYTQPVYGSTMDAQPTAFAAADYTELGPTGGLSPNGSTKYLDTGLQIAHMPTTRHHLSAYEVTKPSGSYRVRIGARETSGGANMHSIFNGVTSDTIGYWQNAVPSGTFISYSESSAFIVGASTATSNTVYKNASSNAASGTPTVRTVFPTTPYYVFALNNGGSPSDYMNNGRLAAYSIGTFLGASATNAASTAIQTFQTTLNRLSIGAGSEYLDVTNADALDWLQRVYLNGGTVSPATATAVNTFCNAIDAAGIRSKFLRLNPFAGNSDGALAAVRTPLYRGPSLAGTQYGSEMDDNVNFVPADYSPTTGLTGNSSSGKYLRTGLPVSAIAGNNLHMGAGLLTSNPNTSTGSSLLGYGSMGGSFVIADRLQSSLPYFQFGAVQGAGPTSGNLSTGNYVASYPTAYQNGFPLANSASSFSNSGASSDFWVFAANGAGGITSSRLGWYSIGTAFAAGSFLAPSTEISAFTSAMAALQTSLGRSAS
jgi:hypothetical protein